MNEDEAILYLLDLGTGATRREKYNNTPIEKIEEVQDVCGVTEKNQLKLKERLSKSDDVNFSMKSQMLQI